MFNVLFNKNNQRIPIKYWLPSRGKVERGAWEQALHMSNLPFAFKHVSLMPDVHQGYGIPIGGVIATENVIIPNAVGNDISCGVQALELDVKASRLREIETGSGKLGQQIGGQIMREIPLGFNKHNESQWDGDLSWISSISKNEWGYKQLEKEGEFENARYQLGTLGGGNHFIELQEDIDNGNLWLMTHTGSRHLGYAIARLFNEKAKELNKRWYSSVPKKWDLAFLPTDHRIGKAYIQWMKFVSAYAKRNRLKIVDKALEIIKECFDRETGKIPYVSTPRLDCNHNYASLEHHFNKNLWIHRKGAIRARKDDRAIIPGSMGSYSYIVEGLGNEQSFKSASHGAGRRMSRNEAKRQFDTQEMIEDFKDQDMFFYSPDKNDSVDEYKKAYKDIDTVMEYEKDLVKPIHKLKTVVVIKG